jgi:hypothetical protein
VLLAPFRYLRAEGSAAAARRAGAEVTPASTAALAASRGCPGLWPGTRRQQFFRQPARRALLALTTAAIFGQPARRALAYANDSGDFGHPRAVVAAVPADVGGAVSLTRPDTPGCITPSGSR